MLDSVICKLMSHEWSPEDANEFINDLDIGDEATIRCRRCGKLMAVIEKVQRGIKWTAHDDEAIMYDLTPAYKKEIGMKQDIERFREENK